MYKENLKLCVCTLYIFSINFLFKLGLNTGESFIVLSNTTWNKILSVFKCSREALHLKNMYRRSRHVPKKSKYNLEMCIINLKNIMKCTYTINIYMTKGYRHTRTYIKHTDSNKNRNTYQYVHYYKDILLLWVRIFRISSWLVSTVISLFQFIGFGLVEGNIPQGKRACGI